MFRHKVGPSLSIPCFLPSKLLSLFPPILSVWPLVYISRSFCLTLFFLSFSLPLTFSLPLHLFFSFQFSPPFLCNRLQFFLPQKISISLTQSQDHMNDEIVKLKGQFSLDINLERGRAIEAVSVYCKLRYKKKLS